MSIRNLLCTLAFVAGPVTLASCQSATQKADEASMFERINTEVLSNSKAYATLGEASQTIGHRLTGSENGRKAEEYTYNLLKSYGFEDVQYQEFEVESWSRGTLTLHIGKGGDRKEFKAVSLAHSPVEATMSGDIVDMGNGLEADFAARPEAAKGKIVLMPIGLLPDAPEGSRNLHRSEKTALAIKYGAAGVIMFNQAQGNILLTGTASVTGKLIPIPAVSITYEDGMALKKRLAAESLQAHISMTNRSGLIKARNVVATLPGSDLSNEKIITGGHLDSWDLATGAIDNGIGSFAVLDIARTFKALNIKPRRTLQFVMFMGEEQGLLGSRAMVEKALADGSIDQIKYIVNLDMVGNPIGINAGGAPQAETFFTEIGAKIASIDSTFKNRFSSRAGLHSDHQPFMLEGVPTLSFASNLDRVIYRCYHSDCDAFDLVNESHLRNTVRFVSMVLYGLANAEQLPAQRMDSETTRQFMIANDLEEALRIAGDWKWEK